MPAGDGGSIVPGRRLRGTIAAETEAVESREALKRLRALRAEIEQQIAGLTQSVQGVQTGLAGVPGAFDPSGLQAQIDDLDARVSALESPPGYDEFFVSYSGMTQDANDSLDVIPRFAPAGCEGVRLLIFDANPAPGSSGDLVLYHLVAGVWTLSGLTIPISNPSDPGIDTGWVALPAPFTGATDLVYHRWVFNTADPDTDFTAVQAVFRRLKTWSS